MRRTTCCGVDQKDAILFPLCGRRARTQSAALISGNLTLFFLSYHCFIRFWRRETEAATDVGVVWAEVGRILSSGKFISLPSMREAGETPVVT